MKATLTWIDPTTLADLVTAIPAGDLAYIKVSRSLDNGQTYDDVGHAAVGQQTFVDDLTGIAPGAVLYEVSSVDTQVPALEGPVSPPASVTLEAPPLAAIAAPGSVAVTLGP